MMKRITSLLLIAIMMCALYGCANGKMTMSWTYAVDTGEKVTVKVLINDGYSISSQVPFAISQNGQILTQGTFIKGEACEQYREAAKTQDGATFLEEGMIGNHQYFAWSFNDSEWNYCIQLKGGKTGILLGNNVSRDSAKEVFSRLEVAIEA